MRTKPSLRKINSSMDTVATKKPTGITTIKTSHSRTASSTTAISNTTTKVTNKIRTTKGEHKTTARSKLTSNRGMTTSKSSTWTPMESRIQVTTSPINRNKPIRSILTIIQIQVRQTTAAQTILSNSTNRATWLLVLTFIRLSVVGMKITESHRLMAIRNRATSQLANLLPRKLMNSVFGKSNPRSS